MGLDVILLRCGRWQTSTRIAKIGTNLFGIYVLSVLIYNHTTWLDQQGVGGFFSFLEMLSEGSTIDSQAALILRMQAFRKAFIIVLIVVAEDTVKRLYLLAKRQIGLPITIPLPIDKRENKG